MKTFSKTDSPSDIQYISYFIKQSFLCRLTIPKRPNLRVKSILLYSQLKIGQDFIYLMPDHKVHEEIVLCIKVISIICTSVNFGKQWLPQSFLDIFSGSTCPLYT